ncbi:MAG: hypothetical protein CL696_08050 [Chloroflexi bacterium]|nr:hypothetical protein [Chloroflexota bacterium]|tara:strand:- start:2589 stop:3059 length:471 start_codon:yes stop_codon:yes gene_type:complete
MQARVMLLTVQEGKIDQLIDVVKVNIDPLLHRLEGFHAGFVFTDEATNRALTVSIWDSEKYMLASEKCPVYLEQIAKLTALLREPPTPQHFETAISAWFGPARVREGPARLPCPDRPGLLSSLRPHQNGQQRSGSWTPAGPPPGSPQPSMAMALGR